MTHSEDSKAKIISINIRGPVFGGNFQPSIPIRRVPELVWSKYRIKILISKSGFQFSFQHCSAVEHRITGEPSLQKSRKNSHKTRPLLEIRLLKNGV